MTWPHGFAALLPSLFRSPRPGTTALDQEAERVGEGVRRALREAECEALRTVAAIHRAETATTRTRHILRGLIEGATKGAHSP